VVWVHAVTASVVSRGQCGETIAMQASRTGALCAPRAKNPAPGFFGGWGALAGIAMLKTKPCFLGQLVLWAHKRHLRSHRRIRSKGELCSGRETSH
jgi:hypothetical protein